MDKSTKILQEEFGMKQALPFCFLHYLHLQVLKFNLIHIPTNEIKDQRFLNVTDHWCVWGHNVGRNWRGQRKAVYLIWWQQTTACADTQSQIPAIWIKGQLVNHWASQKAVSKKWTRLLFSGHSIKNDHKSFYLQSNINIFGVFCWCCFLFVCFFHTLVSGNLIFNIFFFSKQLKK